MTYKYYFFISHTTKDLGRLLALELKNQLAMWGLKAYVANLENIRVRDDEYLKEKLNESRSFLAIGTDRYLSRLNKNLLAPDNYIALEFREGIHRHMDNDRGFFVLGFGETTQYALRTAYNDTDLIKQLADRDSGTVSKFKAGKHVIYEPVANDHGVAEGIRMSLRKMRAKRELRKFFAPQSDPNQQGSGAEDYGSPAVMYYSSIPKVIEEAYKALKGDKTSKNKDMKNGLLKTIEKIIESCGSPGDKADKVCAKAVAGMHLVPHKLTYANTIGAKAYIEAVATKPDETPSADQAGSVLSDLLCDLHRASQLYVADGRLEGYVDTAGPNEAKYDKIKYDQYYKGEYLKSLDHLLKVFTECLNFAARGNLNVVALGIGGGRRDTEMLQAMLALAWRVSLSASEEDRHYYARLHGAVRYLFTDVSMPLVKEGHDAVQELFSATGDCCETGIAPFMKVINSKEQQASFHTLLEQIEVQACFCSFRDIAKLKTELNRRPNTRNLFMLLGNTYPAVTDEERKQFIEGVTNVTEPGDFLLLEIDTRCSKNAYDKVTPGTKDHPKELPNPSVSRMLTSFLYMLPECQPIDPYNDETLSEYKVWRMHQSSKSGNNHLSEVLFTWVEWHETSEKLYELPIPLLVMPVGYEEEECADFEYMQKVFIRQTSELMKDGSWNLEAVIPLYRKKDTTETLVIGIMRRVPESKT